MKVVTLGWMQDRKCKTEMEDSACKVHSIDKGLRTWTGNGLNYRFTAIILTTESGTNKQIEKVSYQRHVRHSFLLGNSVGVCVLLCVALGPKLNSNNSDWS